MTMTCRRCGKRLSRKTARQIDGEALCSTCMFQTKPREGSAPAGEDARSAAEAEGREPGGEATRPNTRRFTHD